MNLFKMSNNKIIKAIKTTAYHTRPDYKWIIKIQLFYLINFEAKYAD